MDKKKRIYTFAAFLVFLIIVFLKLYSYRQGNWYLIDSNGDLVSVVGYEETLGELIIDNEKYYLLSRKNSFEYGSVFYRESLFVVDKNGKVIFKGSTGDGGDISVEDRNSLLYKGNRIFLNSEGEITYTVPNNITIEGAGINYGIMPFYYNDNNSDKHIYGYINSYGEIVIAPQFYGASSFSKEGLAPVKNEEGKYGFINLSGEIVIPEKYDSAVGFTDGLAPVWVDGRSFFIDTKGEEVIDIDAYIFKEGFFAVRNSEKKWAYYDKNKNALTDYIFDMADDFKNGYACVCIDGLYGCIDNEGKFVIEPKYTGMGDFCDNGLAAAEIDDEYWGFVNTHGEWVIKPKYLSGYDFEDGVALVEAPSKLVQLWNFMR